MKYYFPHIGSIDHVATHVPPDQFIYAQKPGYTVVNYMVASPETFPDVDPNNYGHMVRRECRGIIFNEEGDLIRRPLHKFFNVNERAETQLYAIDWSKPHVILEKLDGSMIAPFIITENGKERLIWGTKMGETDFSKQVEAFVADHIEYEDFAIAMIRTGATPIFEWCTRQNRIVIDYPEDRLVLTAIRRMDTGIYIDYRTMVQIAELVGVEVVKAFDPMKDIESFIKYASELEDQEGFVVRFDDGHMVKVKSQWYVQIHKAKDAISNERLVVQMILDGTIDDVKAFLPPLDLRRLQDFEEEFFFALDRTLKELRAALENDLWACDGNKKVFALECAHQLDPIKRTIIFACWDAEDLSSAIKEQFFKVLRKHLTKNIRYQEFKQHYFTDISYEGTFTNDQV